MRCEGDVGSFCKPVVHASFPSITERGCIVPVVALIQEELEELDTIGSRTEGSEVDEAELSVILVGHTLSHTCHLTLRPVRERWESPIAGCTPPQPPTSDELGDPLRGLDVHEVGLFFLKSLLGPI